MKKFISLLLCTTLLISLFCINVNAAEAEELTVPRVYVTTDDGNGNTIEKADGYVGANVKIEDVDGSVLEDKASFKVRGNSTALAEKKPFTFKFSKKKDVLGMGKGKKWALLANCFDPTLMRNYIAFDIATSSASTTPRTRSTSSCGSTECSRAATPSWSLFSRARAGSISISRATTA